MTPVCDFTNSCRIIVPNDTITINGSLIILHYIFAISNFSGDCIKISTTVLKSSGLTNGKNYKNAHKWLE